jgi:hypothetical protein
VKISAQDDCQDCGGAGYAWAAWSTHLVEVNRNHEVLGYLCHCARITATEAKPTPPAEAHCSRGGCGDTPTSRWTARDRRTVYACPDDFTTLMHEHGIVH